MAQMINEGDFESTVLHSDKPVMVDFFAVWCSPCKMIAPYVEEVGSQFEERAEVFKVDIDKNESLCERFGISAVPSLLFFKNGECVDRIVGAVSKSDIEDKLKTLI